MNQEEAQQIKAQLLKQLENLELENKEQIKKAIKLMNPEQLGQFLKQNKIQYKESKQTTGKQECIFCQILEGKIPTYKIDENKKAIAILELNPLSRGHTIVISKEHKKLPSTALTLANKIAKRLKSKLRPKPEDVKIQTDKIFNHNLVNVIPIYKNSKLESKKATQKELILLQDKLEKKSKQTTSKKKTKSKQTEIIKLPKAPIRIP